MRDKQFYKEQVKNFNARIVILEDIKKKETDEDHIKLADELINYMKITLDQILRKHFNN